MTAGSDRERLHRLIDQLPERDLAIVERLVKLLAGRNGGEVDDESEAEPWLRELLGQLSPGELAAIHAAPEDEAARLIVEHAERRDILIPDEDDHEVP